MAAVPFLPYASDVKVGFLIGLAGTFVLSLGRFPAAFFQVNLRLDLQAVLDIVYRVLSLGAVVAVVRLGLRFYAMVIGLGLAGLLLDGSSFAASKRFWRINVRGGHGPNTRFLV